MNYPYILKQTTLKEILKRITSIGLPPKFTGVYLESLGYKSSNDKAVLSVLKFINFLDSSGVPTELYKKYRTNDSEEILKEGIKKGYSDLFDVYSDANSQSDALLINFFVTKTDAGKRVQRAMVATFKTLCSIANFDSTPSTSISNGESNENSNKINSIKKVGMINAPALNINIQIELPGSATPEQYESIFKNMRKYLFDENAE